MKYSKFLVIFFFAFLLQLNIGLADIRQLTIPKIESEHFGRWVRFQNFAVKNLKIFTDKHFEL